MKFIDLGTQTCKFKIIHKIQHLFTKPSQNDYWSLIDHH